LNVGFVVDIYGFYAYSESLAGMLHPLLLSPFDFDEIDMNDHYYYFDRLFQ
jgi:hypothetical protein